MNARHFAITGTNGLNSWLQLPGYSLGALLDACPAIVETKYLAVTACDGGSMVLTESEVALGWRSEGGVSYSPKVTKAQHLYWAGYDEWYAFREPCQFDKPEVFVNYSGFGLHNPWSRLAMESQPSWDRQTYEQWAEACVNRNRRFWVQMAKIGAETYIADGDNVLLVTAHKELFVSVKTTIQGKGMLIRQDEQEPS